MVAVSQIPAIRHLDWLPLRELGVTAIGSGVVAAWFEYRARRDWITRITDAILEGFAADPHDLARRLSPATVDKIAENSLALRLGNDSLAAYMVTDFTAQVQASQGRLRYDAHIAATVSRWNRSLYLCSVRCSHRTEAPLVVLC
ncbi:hypothetical protein [Amycolatopsis minnesotensis]|uniref:Uncharacterized protein n=1 Tax=Amycolatopsis minnesotensis TaxID=337894 RepID=A0ABN2T105_9PSEU